MAAANNGGGGDAFDDGEWNVGNIFGADDVASPRDGNALAGVEGTVAGVDVGSGMCAPSACAGGGPRTDVVSVSFLISMNPW